MTIADDPVPEGGDDLLAAEFVLGVLDAGERRAATLRIDGEPEFARLVDHWEKSLAPLAGGYEPVEPPPAVKAAIDRRIFARPDSEPRRAGLLQSLAFWRGLAAAAIAALLMAIALPYLSTPAPEPQARLVASLNPEGSDVHYLAVYDPAVGDVALSHVSGARAEGHDFELWMIQGGEAPASMGVIPVGASVHIAVKPAERSLLAGGATLAISLEPAGGSPTGQPTGPVVSAGNLFQL